MYDFRIARRLPIVPERKLPSIKVAKSWLASTGDRSLQKPTTLFEKPVTSTRTINCGNRYSIVPK